MVDGQPWLFLLLLLQLGLVGHGLAWVKTGGLAESGLLAERRTDGILYVRHIGWRLACGLLTEPIIPLRLRRLDKAASRVREPSGIQLLYLYGEALYPDHGLQFDVQLSQRANHEKSSGGLFPRPMIPNDPESTLHR